MYRFLFISCLAAAGIGAASAEQIQIGQVIGNVNAGLTASYISGGCAGANGPSFAGCLAGSTGSGFFMEKGYSAILFNNSTLGTAAPNGFNAGGCDINTKVGCASDGSTQFALIDDSTATQNYWRAVGDMSGGSGTLTIPVGIYGADGAWTMINNEWGITGAQNTVVKFLFGTSSNTTDAGSLSFVLTNGVEVRDVMQCLAANSSAVDCTTFATGTSSSGTKQVYTSGYTLSGGGSIPYSNTSGNVALDDQSFSFGNAFLNDYLTEIQITDQNGGNQIGRTALSAVTVDVASAPEPSTILMVVTGLGAFALAYRRRRVQ